MVVERTIGSAGNLRRYFSKIRDLIKAKVLILKERLGSKASLRSTRGAIIKLSKPGTVLVITG